MTAPLGFIERYGHVPVDIARGARAIGKWWAAECFCEFPDCASREPAEVDHCHAHGWVRGWICTSHNVRLGRLEAVMQMDGIRVDLGSSLWGQYLAACPACTGSPLIRARDRFSPAYYAPVTGPVAPEESRCAHLRARPDVSLCGQVRGRVARRTICRCAAVASVSLTAGRSGCSNWLNSPA